MSRGNNTAATNLQGLGTVGAQVTKTQSVKTSSAQAPITTTKTAGTRLLTSGLPTGLVTFDAIQSKASVTLNLSGYVEKGEATFVGLEIAGITRSAKPAPNTTINIPGGRVILNQQGILNQFGLHSQGVIGLQVAGPRVSEPSTRAAARRPGRASR